MQGDSRIGYFTETRTLCLSQRRAGVCCTTVTLTAKADGSTVYGCDIYYTTNGTTPSRNNGTKYSSGVTINSACTLKAIAYKSGYEDSNVLTATYTVNTEPVKVVSVTAGFYNSWAIKDNEELWYWGGSSERNTPKLMTNSVSAVSVGNDHTMILKTDGTLWALGANDSWQLGDESIDYTNTPKQVLSNVSAVSAGGSHTMIIKKGSSLWACGYNYYGQLGNGTTTDISTPKQVMSSVASVSAGEYHTMILKTDGTLWACGSNKYGQLGDGTTKNVSTPKPVMSGVASVSAGASHTMIVKTDGTLWVCGSNEYGQLGDGTTNSVSTPKQVMSGVASVSAGKYHTLILKTDGTLWACGRNYAGQLGDGTTVDRLTPVQVKFGDESAIPVVTSERNSRQSVFSLSGQRLTAPRRGVNIIGGKKVVVR